MNGSGLFKGLSVTLKRFIDSYTEDFRWLFKRYGKVEFRSSSAAKGTFTVQYPEEKLLVPEEFRYKPFLLYEEGPKGELGFYVVSSGKPNPYRYHVRAPSFVNITSLEKMCVGTKIADFVGILGMIDIVLGELDR